jgi:hypothetical protein
MTIWIVIGVWVIVFCAVCIFIAVANIEMLFRNMNKAKRYLVIGDDALPPIYLNTIEAAEKYVRNNKQNKIWDNEENKWIYLYYGKQERQ